MSDAAWPWPGENALQRTRRIALAYREYLRSINPELCESLDQTMRAYGQMWVAPEVITVEPHDTVTTREAALLVSVNPDTIRQWACTPHPEMPGQMLLPRHGRRGRSTTYIVAHVRAAATIMEHSKQRRSRVAA